MRERRPDFVMAKDRFYVGPLFCCGGSVALCWRVRIGEIWGLKMTEFYFLIVFFLFYALRASFDWLWAALMEVVGKRGATDFIGRFLVSVVTSDLFYFFLLFGGAYHPR